MANNNGSLPSSIGKRGSNASIMLQNISGRTNPGLSSSPISTHNGLSQLSNFSNRSQNFEYAQQAEDELDAAVEAQALAEAERNAAQLEEPEEVHAAQAHLEELAEAAYAGYAGPLPANWLTKRGPFNQSPRITRENLREYPSLSMAKRNGLVPKGPSKKTRPKRKSRRTNRRTRRR